MDSDQSRLLPVSVKDLVRDLRPEQPSTTASTVLLIDVRPNAQFCNGHIESAENVNFSNILLRRLLKGVVSLESLLPSTELAEKIKSLEDHGGSTESRKLVVYDWCSNEDGVKVELAKHAEVLATASGSGSVYFLNGKTLYMSDTTGNNNKLLLCWYILGQTLVKKNTMSSFCVHTACTAR